QRPQGMLSAARPSGWYAQMHPCCKECFLFPRQIGRPRIEHEPLSLVLLPSFQALFDAARHPAAREHLFHFALYRYGSPVTEDPTLYADGLAVPCNRRRDDLFDRGSNFERTIQAIDNHLA